MMSFWEIFEEIAYVYHMLSSYQAVVFVGILILFPPFMVSLYSFFRSSLDEDQVWFVGTMINFIINLILSTQINSIFVLIIAFLLCQIAALKAITHLLKHEK